MEPVAPRADRLPAAAASDLRVLVAEDNVVNQKVVLMLLKQLGVKADLAADGSQAIAAARRNRYDLMVCGRRGGFGHVHRPGKLIQQGVSDINSDW